jgi:cation diffusion facilitator family transporter
MAGLGIIWIGHEFFPASDIRWIDPVAALFVAVLILHTAYNLTVRSFRDLLDAKLPPEEEDCIRNIISHQSAINGFHQLRTRRAGNIRFVEFHIKVDPQISVSDSHKITKILEQNIRQKFPDSSITIHIEPCDGECEDICAAGCLLPEGKKPGGLKSAH